MLTEVHPRLPMRNHAVTRHFYENTLGFTPLGDADFTPYLMERKEQVEIHFFLYEGLDPHSNYGMVYIRCSDIRALYRDFQNRGIAIHPNGALALKPYGQWEFSISDPDHNLLTFGQKA